jgi:di/tricarboxylate transporter
MALPPVTTGALVVFGLIVVALVLFVTEVLPTDVTAIAVLVTLAVLEPVTNLTAREAISGFASPATVTVLAMFVLSAGVQRTGIVSVVGVHIARYTRGSESRLLSATVGVTGVVAGVINNTPVVAVFIPMINDLCDDAGISPSRLLLPLSYAAMLGGTLTLVGTSTNIVASDLSRQLIGRPISMFTLTPVGLLVLAVGLAYLLTVGRWLLPDRVDPSADLTAEYDLEGYLTTVRVPENSRAVGVTVDDLAGQSAADGADADAPAGVDVLQVRRDGETVPAPGSDRILAVDDVLTVKGSRAAVNAFADANGLEPRFWERVDEDTLDAAGGDGHLVEAVVPPSSRFAGVTIEEAAFTERHDTHVLAVLRGGEYLTESLEECTLETGDTLLLWSTAVAVLEFVDSGDLLISQGLGDIHPELVDADIDAAADATTDSAPSVGRDAVLAIGIVGAVIAVAAIGLVPIVIAALGGMVAMFATGLLTPTEGYDAVGWNVIFLLAGILPLGLAMQSTGGDAVIAAILAQSADFLPVIGVLALFYLVTGLLSNVITPLASVVLLIPVAVDAAARIGANRFAFVLAVTFAGSAAFMTPVGYQTNLMVYGPGGYRFTDYLRLGAPLQLLLTPVTTIAIAVVYGLAPA